MTEKVLNGLDVKEFDALLDQFIDREGPDTMSFAALEEAATALVQAATAETVELTGVVRGEEIVFDQPAAPPIVVRGNEIVIGGLRLVVKLRSQAT